MKHHEAHITAMRDDFDTAEALIEEEIDEIYDFHGQHSAWFSKRKELSALREHHDHIIDQLTTTISK